MVSGPHHRKTCQSLTRATDYNLVSTEPSFETCNLIESRVQKMSAILSLGMCLTLLLGIAPRTSVELLAVV